MNFVSEGYWRAASEGDAFGPAGMRSPCAASPDAASAKMARARHERELALRLCEAAREGELEDVERFVACGVPLDVVDRKGDYSTPLIEAIQSRKLGPAAHLLAKGASPHLSGAQGWPPLAVAFLTKQAPMADLLLEAGADVKAPGAEGITCLHIAAYLGWAEGLQRCLRALEEAAARAHHAAAAAASPAGGAAGGVALAGLPSLTVRPPGEPLPLLKAALDAADAAGNTPHMLACLGGWHELAAELRRYGASHGASNRDGATALHLAAGGVRLWCQHPLLEAATRSHAPKRPHMLPPQPRLGELGAAGAAGTQPPQGPPRTPSALSAARRPGGVGGVAKASTPRSSDIARAILLTPRSRNRPGMGPGAGGATPSGGSASGGSGLRRLCPPEAGAPPTSGGSGSAASGSEGVSFFASAVGSPLAAGASSAAPAARERTPFGSPLAASAPRGPLSMASQPAAAAAGPATGQPPRPAAREGGKELGSVNPPLGMQAIHTAAPAGSPDGDVATASGGGGGGSPAAAGAGSAGQRGGEREEQPALLARDYTSLLLALLPLEEPHQRMLQQPDRLGRLPHQVAVECLHAEAAGILLPAIAHRAKWLQRRAATGLLGAASPGTGELTTPAHDAAPEGAPLRPAALGAWAFQQVSALAEDAWKLLTLPPPLREPVLEVEFAHGEEEARASIAATRAILGSPLSAEAEEAAAQRLSGEQAAAPASPLGAAAGREGGHVHAGAGCDTPTPVVCAVFGRAAGQGSGRLSAGSRDPVALAEAAAAGTARFAGQPWPDAALLQKDLQPVGEVWLRHCARDAAVVGAALLEVAASCGSLHLNVAALDASVLACVHGTPGVTSPVPSAASQAPGTPESTGGSGVSGVVRPREDALAVLLAPVLNSLRTAAEAGSEGTGAAPAAPGASPVESGLPLTDANSPTRVAISAIAKAWLRVAAWQRRIHVVSCRARRS